MVLPDIPVEERLLTRARAGDQNAVMQIYEIFFSPLYHYIRLRVDDRMLAEDLTSEVFIRLINALRGPNPPKSSLRGWLFQVARHVIYDHRGAEQKLPTTALDEWISASGDESEPEIQAIRSIDRQRSREALQMLPADQQEVLVLRFGNMLNLQETADVMGKSVSAVKSLQFRAVASLRSILGEMGLTDVRTE